VSLRRVTGFVDDRGVWRELKDPDGPPTWRQLVALHRAGMLQLVDPDPWNVFSKSQASAAIDTAVVAGLLEPRRPPDPDPEERFDRVCRQIVECVRGHPGCPTLDVLQAVRGRRAYVRARVRDLLKAGALEDRAARRGRGQRRELYVADTGEEREA
jgi:hypothetical protein